MCPPAWPPRASFLDDACRSLLLPGFLSPRLPSWRLRPPPPLLLLPELELELLLLEMLLLLLLELRRRLLRCGDRGGGSPPPPPRRGASPLLLLLLRLSPRSPSSPCLRPKRRAPRLPPPRASPLSARRPGRALPSWRSPLGGPWSSAATSLASLALCLLVMSLRAPWPWLTAWSLSLPLLPSSTALLPWDAEVDGLMGAPPSRLLPLLCLGDGPAMTELDAGSTCVLRLSCGRPPAMGAGLPNHEGQASRLEAKFDWQVIVLRFAHRTCSLAESRQAPS